MKAIFAWLLISGFLLAGCLIIRPSVNWGYAVSGALLLLALVAVSVVVRPK